MFNIWTPAAVSSEGFGWQGSAWRLVEAQHIASTMKIVDTEDEQSILESLLESNKPNQLQGSEALDYLLSTPFRYRPLRDGSRFRAANDQGVFYAAESVRTASAELGYWRWKFLKDAPEITRIEPVAHTAFRVEIATSAVDLRKSPFDSNKDVWMHKTDYSATQAFARVIRDAGIGSILYQSVRDPHPSWCIALLTPAGFAKPKPHSLTQTWWISVNQDCVIWRRKHESVSFAADYWV